MAVATIAEPGNAGRCERIRDIENLIMFTKCRLMSRLLTVTVSGKRRMNSLPPPSASIEQIK
jgi:hypothetical protein